jgi:transcriptional regulator with XRE-family HTH domain
MSDMASDHGPVVQSAVLRDELVRLRKDRGLTQDQVATNLEWAVSALIRAEGGRTSIADADLESLLQQYGVDAVRRERLHRLNRGSRAEAWWDDYRNDVSAVYLDYVGYETGAAAIRQFPGTVVPGLLQTRGYAEALTAMSVESARVVPVVELRLRRQSELAQRETPPRQYYILDEALIRRRIGIRTNRAIMPEQLMRIVRAVQDSDRITVQVIPFEVGEHAGLSGPFTVLEFAAGLPDLLYLDDGRGFIELTNRDNRVAEYADHCERLREAALPAAESLALIRTVAEEIS